MMEPSKAIIQRSARTTEVTDEGGRVLLVRIPTALDTLRLFKAAGPVLAQNDAWLALASLAFAVDEIDHVPVPPPLNEAQIEGIVERLGDSGLAAVAALLHGEDNHRDTLADVGNLLGTPS